MKKKKKIPKSFWNYRILAFEEAGDPDPFFVMYEVYYENGKPIGYGAEANLLGHSKKELKKIIKYQKEAIKKPILWGDERFPKQFKKL